MFALKHCLIGIGVALSLAVCATNARAHSQVFSTSTFEQAQSQAQKDGKLLLIDFTASWCPPCQRMESTTWADEAVQSWIKENALAMQVDVDQDPKTSAKLNVKAMPTLVLFSPKNIETEVGRQIGYLDASSLLRWLEGAKSGKTPQELAQDEDQSNSNAVFDRFSKARELQANGKNAEALAEYVWIWNNVSSTDSNISPIRLSAVPMELRSLVTIYPVAKLKVTEMRDAAEKSDHRRDWILLNGVLNENERTLAWFDKIKLDPQQSATIQKNSSLLESVLFSKARYADCTKYLYPNPIVKLNEIFKRAQDIKKPRPDTEFAKDFDAFPSMVTLLYSAYLGAGKTAEAQKISSECLRLDDTPAMREALKSIATGMARAAAAAK